MTPLFAEDGRVVFGNGQPLVGIDEIRPGITNFYDTIAGLHHEIVSEWNVGDDTIVEFKVTYDRKDGQQVTIPCVTIFHHDAAGKIDATASTSTLRPFMPDHYGPVASSDDDDAAARAR